jgi:hypothetical protein
MKSTVFSIVTPCSSKKVLRFGGTYILHFQGRSVGEVGNHQDAGGNKRTEKEMPLYKIPASDPLYLVFSDT